jgi:hypothetical protein
VKTLILALTLAGICGMAAADERMVLVPKDSEPFIARKDDLVRLSGKGISGSRIEVKIEGPAKVEATNIIRELHNGRALIGNIFKEFDLKPTDAGKVTASITVSPPNGEPRVTKFEFEVK